HSDQGVLAPRSGRILRYDQCALGDLTRRCSRRALAGASSGSAARPPPPRMGGSCRLTARLSWSRGPASKLNFLTRPSALNAPSRATRKSGGDDRRALLFWLFRG